MWVIMMLTLAAAVATDCPQHCECKWRNGKDAALCHHGGFTTIPTGLLSSTQLLDVSENRFLTLRDHVFNNTGLLNLQRLYLSTCSIRIVQPRAFWGLKNLVELDLSNNKLNSVPTHSFSHITDLRDLKLNGNPISILKDEAFRHLRDLVRLTLSSCQISVIEPRSFFGLESSLQYLELSRNMLKVINVSVLAPLRALKDVALSGNPWECTCILRPMRDWMIKRNVPVTITPECAMPPRLKSQPWSRIDLDDFACTPDVKVITNNVKGLEGSDIVLICKVSGIPAPRVRWYRAGRLLANSTTSTHSGRSYVVRSEGQISNLTIKTADMHDAGPYTCYAENQAGKADVVIELIVEKSPQVHFRLQGLIAGITITAVIIVCSCFIGVCILESRKGGRLDRLNEQIVVSYQNDEVRLNSNKGDTDLTMTPTDISRKRGDYRNVPSHDPEDSLYSNNFQENINSILTPLPPSIHRSDYESRNYRHEMPENDLHIPRHIQSTTSQQLLMDKVKAPTKNSSDYYNNNSKSYNRPRTQNFSYSHISINDNDKNYPDLIEMNSYERPSMRNEIKYEPHYFTIRRRKDGDSSSPLIDSRRNSSGGDSTSIYERSLNRNRHSSWNRRSNSSSDLTLGNNRSRHNPSLPTSPTRDQQNTLSATPLLDVSSLHKYSRTNYSRTTEELEFQVLQLEHFLDEYRTIGNQLFTSSKETKDNLQRSRPIVSEELIMLRGPPYVTGISSSLALPDAASPLMLNASDLGNQSVPERRSMYLN